MEIVIVVPICENKNGDRNDAGNYRPVSLATTIFSNVLRIVWTLTISCISLAYLQPPQTTSLVLSQKNGTENVHIFTQTDCVVLCKLKYPSQCL